MLRSKRRFSSSESSDDEPMKNMVNQYNELKQRTDEVRAQVQEDLRNGSYSEYHATLPVKSYDNSR